MRKGLRRGQQNESVLALVGVDGSNYRELPESGNRIAGPTGALAWSKDGRSILYASADKPIRVMRLPIDGGKPSFTGLTIEARGALSHHIDFNPNGSRIVFGQGDSKINELWAIENVLAAIRPPQR
jgi:WD40 repeat protein